MLHNVHFWWKLGQINLFLIVFLMFNFMLACLTESLDRSGGVLLRTTTTFIFAYCTNSDQFDYSSNCCNLGTISTSMLLVIIGELNV